MVKKIIFGVVIVIALACVIGYLYFDSEINKAFPSLMDSTKELLIESCEYNSQCIEAIKYNFFLCKQENYIEEVGLFTFQDEYMKFLTNVHKCIQNKSGVELPGIWDYMMQQKLNE